MSTDPFGMFLIGILVGAFGEGLWLLSKLNHVWRSGYDLGVRHGRERSQLDSIIADVRENMAIQAYHREVHDGD